MGRVSTAGKAVIVAGGAAVTIGVQTSPTVAASNLSAWLKLFGIERIPPFLLRPEADDIGLAIGIGLIVIGLLWWWWDKRRNGEPTIDEWIKDMKANHTISSVDQRGGITAHTVNQDRDDGR